MMAWDRSGNWSTELARLGLSRRLTQQQIEEFFPPYPGDGPVALADHTSLYRQFAAGMDFDRLMRALPAPPPAGLGSNNLVVSGKRTDPGAPLLAKDPPPGLPFPTLWCFPHP